jgi:hypothetical protein
MSALGDRIKIASIGTGRMEPNLAPQVSSPLFSFLFFFFFFSLDLTKIFTSKTNKPKKTKVLLNCGSAGTCDGGDPDQAYKYIYITHSTHACACNFKVVLRKYFLRLCFTSIFSSKKKLTSSYFPIPF